MWPSAEDHMGHSLAKAGGHTGAKALQLLGERCLVIDSPSSVADHDDHHPVQDIAASHLKKVSSGDFDAVSIVCAGSGLSVKQVCCSLFLLCVLPAVHSLCCHLSRLCPEYVAHAVDGSSSE